MNIRSAVLKLLTDVGIFISFYRFGIVEHYSCTRTQLSVVYVWMMAPKNLIANESFMPLVVSN